MHIYRWRLEWQESPRGRVHIIEKKILGGSPALMLEKLPSGCHPTWTRVTRRLEGEWEHVDEKEMN
jgi:hypothetical protein